MHDAISFHSNPCIFIFWVNTYRESPDPAVLPLPPSLAATDTFSAATAAPAPAPAPVPPFEHFSSVGAPKVDLPDPAVLPTAPAPTDTSPAPTETWR